MAESLYNRDILRLAAAIPHQGRLERPMASVEKSSPICGSRVTVDIVMDSEGRVSEIAQQVRACALGQASAALLGAHVLGRSGGQIGQAHRELADYLTGLRADPGDWPGLSIFAQARHFPARHAAILLAFDATAEAATLAVTHVPTR